LKTARTEESARPGIKGVGLVAATGERARQAALDPVGGDLSDEISEASEGFYRKAGENVVFGVPTRTADAFDRERSDPAVERLEMPAIVGGNPNPGHDGDVETRLVVHHDDVRALAGRLAGRTDHRFEPVGSHGVGFHESVRHQLGDRGNARSHEVGNVVVAIEGVVRRDRKDQ